MGKIVKYSSKDVQIPQPECQCIQLFIYDGNIQITVIQKKMQIEIETLKVILQAPYCFICF